MHTIWQWTWATQSKSLLDRLGFSEAWIEPELMNLTTFMCEVKERLTDQYTQSWRQMLRESTGKLRTYRTFKHDFRMEAYLNLPVYLRIPVTKFRVSAHPLRIETGRYALYHNQFHQERDIVGSVRTQWRTKFMFYWNVPHMKIIENIYRGATQT